ncbi:MAG TPA: ketoacyl-ACP synthase III, partial [Phaeodactylibacter sp.]|nr:ketoacyl-ACP synthase III [Phaeodactylibacter sp.]
KIEDIDCLIGASATFDYIIPNRASMVKNQFEKSNDLDFPCLDINTVCTSFITAMEYASHLLQTEDYQNIAIVSSEVSSKGLNPDDPKTYCLFGDAAAAVILSKTKKEGGLVKYALKNYTESVLHTRIEGGGNENHPKDTPYDSAMYSFKMEGRHLLRTARKYMSPFFDKFYNNIPTTLKNTDWIVPHQTSKMGFKLLEQLNEDKSENIVNILSTYGNCISASIPLAFISLIKGGKLKENDTCMLTGTAAGLSISGLLLKYTTS